MQKGKARPPHIRHVKNSGVVRFFWCSASGCNVHWWVDSPKPPSSYLDLSVVLRSVRGALGGWCARGVLGHALGLILYARLAGVCLRMERLAVRFAAGRLWRVAARVRVGSAISGGRAGARIWPGRFGWLVRLAGWEAAGFGSQLRAVLQTPEMVALLEASPQAGRILRPVCRMLALETSLLRPRAAAGTAAAVDAVANLEVSGAVAEVGRRMLRRIREAVDLGRIPLPRGVLAAARRQGFGRVLLEKG